MSEEEEMKGKLLFLLSTCFAIIHHGKTVSKVKTNRYTVKKRLAIFSSPARMSLTKLSLAGKFIMQ
jgi:hypothetical protein